MLNRPLEAALFRSSALDGAPVVSGGGGLTDVDISVTYSSGYTPVSDYSKTWSAPLGADDSNRRIVVVAWCDNIKTMNMSLGGVAMTQIVQKLSSYWGSIGIFISDSPSGASANISMGVGGDHFISTAGIVVHRLLTTSPSAASSTTFAETSTTAPALSTTVPAHGGTIVGFAADRNISGAWSNATLGGTATGTNGAMTAAWSIAAGTANRTWTGTSATYVGAAATWNV